VLHSAAHTLPTLISEPLVLALPSFDYLHAQFGFFAFIQSDGGFDTFQGESTVQGFSTRFFA
jgi:hypothetical protein